MPLILIQMQEGLAIQPAVFNGLKGHLPILSNIYLDKMLNIL